MLDTIDGAGININHEVIVTTPSQSDQEFLKGVSVSQAFRNFVERSPEERSEFVFSMINDYGIAAYAIMDGGADHCALTAQMA